MSQFDWDEARHGLGVEAMDGVHREFLALARALEDCPSSLFAERLAELAHHTEAHFAVFAFLAVTTVYRHWLPVVSGADGVNVSVLPSLPQA